MREDTFSGNKNEDAHDHIDRVLSIVSLFGIPGVSKCVVMLRVFLFTLTGAAKRWVDRLTPGVVNTWDLLKKAFIQRYCSPSKTAKQLEDIYNFKQEGDESLFQAWEWYNDLLYKCPTHDINIHQKWHNETMSGSISSNNNNDALAAIVSNLDNLGRDMKKLKENVHAIQVGYQICKGRHLEKDCPLSQEIKKVEEVKYENFRRPAPFNGNHESMFRIGPPGYFTRTDNRPSYGEKRPSLEELMNRHQEESARRSAKMEETANGAPSSYTGQCKVVNADQGMPSKIKNVHEVSFLSDFEFQVAQNEKEEAIEILQIQLLPKDLNLGNFTLHCTIGNFNFYVVADLGASVNVIPRGIFECLKLTNLRKTNMLVEMADMTKKAPLGVVENVLVRIDTFLFSSDFVILDRTPSEDRINFDMEKQDHNFTKPTAKLLMENSIRKDEPSCLQDDHLLKSNTFHDRFGNDMQEQQKEYNGGHEIYGIDKFDKLQYWYCDHDEERKNMKGGGLSFPNFLLVRYEDCQQDDLIWGQRYAEWCSESSHDNKPRPRD
ncbi:cysteine-rich receptor-like protein kinase [Tanacetum coccineum]